MIMLIYLWWVIHHKWRTSTSNEWVSATSLGPVSVIACIFEWENLEREGREGLFLVVHSAALMNDCNFWVITQIRTDIAPERLPIGMVKECSKDRLAFDSQQIGFKRTIMSNYRVPPSVEILMFAQPSSEAVENLITGCVHRATMGVALSTRRTRSEMCTLRDWWHPGWLKGYRRNESASWLADSSQTR